LKKLKEQGKQTGQRKILSPRKQAASHRERKVDLWCRQNENEHKKKKSGKKKVDLQVHRLSGGGGRAKEEVQDSL